MQMHKDRTLEETLLGSLFVIEFQSIVHRFTHVPKGSLCLAMEKSHRSHLSNETSLRVKPVTQLPLFLLVTHTAGPGSVGL